MGSLSFEDFFCSKPDDRAESAVRNSQSLPAAWSDPPLTNLVEMRTVSEASPWAKSLWRRLLDCSAAGFALAGFFPLMVIAAALVRLGSAGPVFFRQKRMGRNGKEFTLYKFRSMYLDSGGNSSITVSGDSRITPVGSFLRRYKLDELPQFWNVLRGEMSLVGPRPKLPHHEALHMTCRPGITGAATLAFRNEEELLSEIPEGDLEAFYESFVKPAKACIDLDYMRTATLWGDLKILWKTATSCFTSANSSIAEPAEAITRYAPARVPPAKVERPAKTERSVRPAAPAERPYVTRFNPEM